jgi:hypothetical protein
MVEEQGRYVPVDRDSAHPQFLGDPGLNPSVHAVPGQKFQYPEPTFGSLKLADGVVAVPAGLAAADFVPAKLGHSSCYSFRLPPFGITLRGPA